jgi:tRNA G18 (ribose-2'-O)-methylase SpoU
MVTDAYLDIAHHPGPQDLGAWASSNGLPVIAVDIVPGAAPLESFPMPEACVLLFGQEGPGLSDEALAIADAVVAITQHDSTRSINVAAAAAIAMHCWQVQHGQHRGTAG